MNFFVHAVVVVEVVVAVTAAGVIVVGFHIVVVVCRPTTTPPTPILKSVIDVDDHDVDVGVVERRKNVVACDQ